MYINSIFIILVFLYFYGCVNLSKRITRGSAGRSTEPKDEAMVCGSDCNHLLGYLPNKHLLFIRLAFNNHVSNRAISPNKLSLITVFLCWYVVIRPCHRFLLWPLPNDPPARLALALTLLSLNNLPPQTFLSSLLPAYALAYLSFRLSL